MTSDFAAIPEVDQSPRGKALAKLSLGALGVVYGDIGTSPLYAIRERFGEHYGEPPTPANVMSVLSLVFWALTLVVAVKYLMFVMRADNRGQGGILALLALLLPDEERSTLSRGRQILMFLALCGTALLFADGVITPAISVLSAIEGIEVVTPELSFFVVPITVAILVGLFAVQRRGTADIGSYFGPIMLLWFAALAAMGIPWIVRQPGILLSISPHHALRMMIAEPLPTFLLLGAVVLVVTGAEALYADMGHFGRRPIRAAWFSLVMPALLLNYMGQGAFILEHGEEGAANPFFFMLTYMAPEWMLYPLVALATVATIIASQALISGAYSLAYQAVQLGFLPRLKIIHTSQTLHGQIYMPGVNTMLMVACVTLVLGFQSSSNLAAAYGIAVVGTMVVTTILLFVVAREKWKWKLSWAVAFTIAFLLVDLTFLASNLDKFKTGGWFPIAAGAAIFIVMTTWSRGRVIFAGHMLARSLRIELFLSDTQKLKPTRVSGTAVFLTANPGITPTVLLHHFKHNKVLHERVVVLTVRTAPVPYVAERERMDVRNLDQGFWQIIASFGFMEQPNVPYVLQQCSKHGLDVDPRMCSYFLGRTTLLTTGRGHMAAWRKRLFAFLFRNAGSATQAFGVPPNRVLELGMQIEL